MNPKETRTLESLNIKIYADGADKKEILDLYKNPFIAGFTTNPSLMKKAGVKDYTSFAKEILTEIKDRDISFELFADDFENMKKQAMIINSWGKNVYVKIPVMNSKGEPTYKLISELSGEGVKLNITAIYTKEQTRDVVLALRESTPAVISVFAGRLADVGTDPVPCIIASATLVSMRANTELLWASTREVYNIYQANDLGCHIITAPKDVLNKLGGIGKISPMQQSLETVKTFLEDAKNVGFSL
jgi:transaldolase